jgi:AsmA-like C-terminal region/Protein of unknown function
MEVIAGCIGMVAVAIGVFAWRLSEAPVQLPWLTHRLERELSELLPGTGLTIGHVALAWEGFKHGVDQPFDIRITDVHLSVSQTGPSLTLPNAAISLSPAALLIGHVVPRSIEIDGAHLRLVRAATDRVLVDLGALGQTANATPDQADRPLADLLSELAHPPNSDNSIHRRDVFSQLSEVAIRDADLTVVDRVMDATWSAPKAEVILQRQKNGGLTAEASAELALGDRHSQLALQASMDPQGAITLHSTLGPLAATVLTRVAPSLSALDGLHAVMNLELTAALSRDLRPGAWSAQAAFGAGSFQVAKGAVPWHSAQVRVQGSGTVPSEAHADAVLNGPTSSPHIVASAAINHLDARWHVDADVTVDRIAMADLPAIWPDGTDNGARAWIVENIPLGTAHDAHFTAGIAATDAGNVQLVALGGSVKGDGVQLWWLRPLPPITDVSGTMRFDNPDSITIADLAGRSGALALSAGTVRITGLTARDQIGHIEGTIAGPVSDAVALLRQPRLHLFDHSSLDLSNPGGTMTGQLHVTLPLDDRVTIDQIAIAAQTSLQNLSLPGFIAGRDLEQGNVTLQVDNNGLTAKGTAAIAAIPTTLSASMDFRGGPPGGVVQQAQASLHASNQQLAAIGLDTEGVMDGAADIQAGWKAYRNGNATVDVRATLDDAVLQVPQLGWQKPRGGTATLTGQVRLERDRLAAIDDIAAQGEDFSLAARLELPAGLPGTVVVDHAVLGRSSMSGQIVLPGKGSPWRIQLSGARIDLSSRFVRGKPHAPVDRPEPEPAGPSWTLDAHFEQALLAKSRPIQAVVAQAASDGHVITRAHLQAGQPTLISADITSGPGGRQLHLTSPDAGEVLRDLDIADDIQGGAFDTQASFDDQSTNNPLSGTATIDNFRVRDAPAMARLLQAMTLYGLADVVQGPGLGFSHLIAPFSLDGDLLALHDARAYSQSLGLTAKGQVDLARQRVDMQGTIVPAYFFNSLLGHVPLLGRLFSPEQGGGVFAATYRVTGPINDPAVNVNPLAALTPGFLRTLFGNL